MENFVLSVVQNPIPSIGYVLSIIGAYGALMFLGGLLGSIKHLVTYSESTDHVEHGRTNSLWGVYICMVTFAVWQCVRVVAGEVAFSSVAILIVLLLSPAWVPWLKALATGKKGGH